MSGATPWPVLLFEKSVLKQAKWQALSLLLDGAEGKDGLDLGSDNGVISYLLRQRGGRWCSADLDEKTVASIRELVGEDVYRIDGRRVPFANASFDLVVVIDMLEHVETDSELVADLARVLRPGGVLILNVPHRKPFPFLRPLRNILGLTDEWHGHLRSGYSVSELRNLLPPELVATRQRTYNRFFSELLDIALNFVVTRKTGTASTAKGLVVTGQELESHARLFRLYSWIYPLAWLWSRLDAFLPWTRGYMLALRAEKIGESEAERLEAIATETAARIRQSPELNA